MHVVVLIPVGSADVNAAAAATCESDIASIGQTACKLRGIGLIARHVLNAVCYAVQSALTRVIVT